MGRIYFSLNWQDIPEFFEDNIAAWMEEFAKYLSYSNPLLVDADEASEPGPVERLQVRDGEVRSALICINPTPLLLLYCKYVLNPFYIDTY
jgi:hypothetical protein